MLYTDNFLKMNIETQALIYLILLMLADTIIPLPITGGILLYVILKKPDWFKELYHQVYR